jgi:uncharacterized membrane protein YdjX (TVP38/TMEM64 family)
MRLLLIFLLLAVVVVMIFLRWGDPLLETFSPEGSVAWLQRYGAWSWLAAIVLLMSDLVLPLPATLIMAAVGYLYGPVTGGVISVAGSFMAGVTGYWLCRWSGEKTALRLLGAKDFERGRKIATNAGGWIVVLSRWLPVFPEVIACMAGLTRMKAIKFHLALLCGTLPLGFTYAYIGSAGVDNPMLAIALSAGLPPLIWLLVSPWFRAKIT